MGVIHIVLFKVNADTSEEAINKALSEVILLKEKIPEIVKASAGKNFTDRAKGYEYALVIELSSKEDLQTYLNHEDHVEFKSQYLTPIMQDCLAFDFEN
ncbi:5113_t:CDS:2 [Ambispora leptoticha]|uniref:5113_t:CDS:1 n=1 Tax=Ambispora leptoticha TaxID=144679 RepID=A0A9N8WIM8_9GLOM|nr:5113_t:CDS:2 [Ambispora leptoticha]